MNQQTQNTAFSRRSILKAAGLGAGLAAMTPLLAACGVSGSTSASKNTKIAFWDYTAAADKVATKEMESITALFAKALPGGSVDRIYVPADQMAIKLIGSGANKQGPDSFLQSGDLDQLVPAGVVADLTSRWDKYADKGKFPDSALSRRDGKLYSVKIYANLIGLWYNQDILDEFSLQPPTTFDELGAALKVIGKKYIGLGIAGSGEGLDGDWQGRPFYSGFGFDYLKPEVAPLEKCFTMLNDWREAGYLPADVSTWTQVTSFPRFTAGQVAFCVNGNWQHGNAKNDAKFKFGVVPMPKGPKGGTVYLGGEEFCLGSFAKDPDSAWKFLESTYLTREAGLIALNMGGSIPLRTDTASDPALDDPIVKQFQLATASGTAYPDAGLGTNVGASRQVMATGWNAMMSGQQSPADAAKSVVAGMQKLLK